MKTFKENLRDELNFQGMTVKELAAKTGLVKGSLDNYLGVRASIPPADVAVKIAKALNVSVEYLVTGKGIEEKELKHEVMKNFYSLPKNMQSAIKDLLKAAAERK